MKNIIMTLGVLLFMVSCSSDRAVEIPKLIEDAETAINAGNGTAMAALMSESTLDKSTLENGSFNFSQLTITGGTTNSFNFKSESVDIPEEGDELSLTVSTDTTDKGTSSVSSGNSTIAVINDGSKANEDWKIESITINSTTVLESLELK